MRRLVAAILAATTLLAVAARPAGAAVILDDWQLSAWGSAHYVLEDNHLVVARQSCDGCLVHVINAYLPWFCEVGDILPGNAAGLPLRIQIIPPAGSLFACLSERSSSTLGWSTGTGYAEGLNLWDSGCVEEYTVTIPSRSQPGTELAVC